MTSNRILIMLYSAMAMAIAAVCTNVGTAQSTIFNIPTTDIVERNKSYFEFDLVTHLERHSAGGFQAYVPRVVYGLSRSVEVGINLGVTHSSAPTLACVQPNVKWRFLSSENHGTALSVGAIAYVPLKEREANDTSL